MFIVLSTRLLNKGEQYGVLFTRTELSYGRMFIVLSTRLLNKGEQYGVLFTRTELSYGRKSTGYFSGPCQLFCETNVETKERQGVLRL
jgi:hypothetical protein